MMKRTAKKVVKKTGINQRTKATPAAVPQPEASDLGTVLRQLILTSGKTHYALGKAAGITPDILDRFMRGERDMRLATASKLAAVLGVGLWQNPQGR